MSGPSFLLWVSENYRDMCRAVEEMALKEVISTYILAPIGLGPTIILVFLSNCTVNDLLFED